MQPRNKSNHSLRKLLHRNSDLIITQNIEYHNDCIQKSTKIGLKNFLGGIMSWFIWPQE